MLRSKTAERLRARRAFIGEALKGNDDTVLAAVLNGPPMLSGMSEA